MAVLNPQFGAETDLSSRRDGGYSSLPPGVNALAFRFTATAAGQIAAVTLDLGKGSATAGEYVRVGLCAATAIVAGQPVQAVGSLPWVTDTAGNPAYVDIPIASVTAGNDHSTAPNLIALAAPVAVASSSIYAVVVACLDSTRTAWGATTIYLGSAFNDAYTGSISSSSSVVAQPSSGNWVNEAHSFYCVLYIPAATGAQAAVGLALPSTGLFSSQTSDTNPGTGGQDPDPGGTGPYMVAWAFTAAANGMVDLIRVNLAMSNQVSGEFIRVGFVSGAYAAAAATPAFGSIAWASDLGGKPAYVDVPVANVLNGTAGQLTDFLMGGVRIFSGSAYSVLIVNVNAAKTGYGTSKFFVGKTTAASYAGGGTSSDAWLTNGASNNWATGSACEVYIYGASQLASAFSYWRPSEYSFAQGATATNDTVGVYQPHSSLNATTYTFHAPPSYSFSQGATKVNGTVGVYQPHSSLNGGFGLWRDIWLGGQRRAAPMALGSGSGSYGS